MIFCINKFQFCKENEQLLSFDNRTPTDLPRWQQLSTFILGLRSIGRSRENRWEILISWVIEQRIQCAITKITNSHSGSTLSSSSRGLDSIRTSPQWQSSCCNLSHLAWPMLTQCLPPLSLATSAAARQQWRHGAKVINNNWQVLGVGLMDTREIARIVASNTARVDLPTWLRSEH